MTRRRRGRRADRREEPALREERAPAPAPPHYGDVERRLAEEVLYLHSLWRSGPPAPAVRPRGGSLATHVQRSGPPAPVLHPRGGSLAAHALHPGGGSLATHVRADRRKRRRLERRAEPEDTGPDWPLAPASPSPSPRAWPDASTSSPSQPPPPPQQPSPASLAQRPALRAAEEFFSGHASEGDDDDSESEGSESEDAGEAAAGFFLGLFERDAELRGYYERSYEEGEFVCMGCVGRRVRRGRARRFRDCASLVQHAHAATRCGRRRAHRALAAAVCRVLGWDIERLPSIVIDPRGTLGQALARKGDSAATATAHVDPKENGGSPGDGDSAKEDVGSGKNSSSSNEEEDVDSGMDDAPSGEVAAKEDVDTGKSGPSSNGNDGEVHEQENVIESAEKDTNAIDPLSSKDTPMELCKFVQEEEIAIDNKQEHGKSADDMGGTSNVSIENNSLEEEAAGENKEGRTNNVVGSAGDDIGNLGTNLMDSSKVYSGTHNIWTSRTEILN